LKEEVSRIFTVTTVVINTDIKKKSQRLPNIFL